MAVADYKRAVRQSFSHAASTYDSVAELQRVMAMRLVQTLPASTRSLKVLDAGSGTGYLGQLLLAQSPGYELFKLDHAWHMCQQTGNQSICGDLEHLPLQSTSLDGYYSNLAWQWVDAVCAAHEAARVLKPGAQLAVSTLGLHTLQELSMVFAGTDQYAHTIPFHPAESYVASLAAAGFTDIRVKREILKAHSPDVATLLSSLRSLGAHALTSQRRPGLLGRRAWQRIQAQYELLREPEGLPLSYDAIYLYAIKSA